MAIQPFDIEGQLPVEINFLTQVTLENFTITRSRQTTIKGSALGVTGTARGIASGTFSFKMPILATPRMTELNAHAFIAALPTPQEKFTMAFRNSVGARKTCIGCVLAHDSYMNTPLQGDAGAEFSGTIEQILDT